MIGMWALLMMVGMTGAGDADQLKVMSLNIRYGTAADGENAWEKRKAFVVETIRAFGPDLLGTQETLGFQRDYLAGELQGYGVLGVGRDDGGEKGEMMALFYREDRFEKLRGGHFWLSETPDQIGSKSWDSSLPRMVTWVVLRDRKDREARPIAYFNTHFDHRGEIARLESARLLRRKAAELGMGCRIVITGDFNCGEGSPPYRALFNEDGVSTLALGDTYRLAHPERAKDEGTFTGFRPEATGGPRIDWIGISPDWEVIEASIDRTSREGRLPSDHFPVTAVLTGRR